MRKYIYTMMTCALLLSVPFGLLGCSSESSDVSDESYGKEADSEEKSGDEKDEETADENRANRVTIYEKDGFKLELSEEYLPTSSDRCCFLIASYEGDGERWYDLDSVVVNDTLVTTGDSGILDSADPVDYKALENLTEDMALADIEEWRSLSCHLTVTDENDETVEDTDLELNLTGKLSYLPAGNLPASAQVEGQVLVDTEELRLTVIYFGNPPGENYKDYVVLKAENLAEYELPVKVNDVSVNHLSVQAYSDKKTIQPRKTVYLEVPLSHNELEELGITDYRDMELLISTSRTEENGGGIWYALQIDGGDEAESWDSSKRILLDTYGAVNIYYLEDGMSIGTYYDGSVYYRWKLFIENNSEDNLELSVGDAEADGVVDKDSSNYTLLDRDTIGSGSFLQTSVTHCSAEGTFCEKVTFSFIYYRNGREELLHKGEPVTLEMDLPSLGTMENVWICPVNQTLSYEDDQLMRIWELLIYNNTEQEITVQLAGLRISGSEYEAEDIDEDSVLYNNEVEAGSSQVMELRLPDELFFSEEYEIVKQEDLSEVEVKLSYVSEGKQLYEESSYAKLETK